jgi:hypothetical protein
MTRLLLAATVIVGLGHVVSALAPTLVRAGSAQTYPSGPQIPVPSWTERFRERPELLRCCFGCWWPDPGGIRYVTDEREMLLAMLPEHSATAAGRQRP